MKRNVCFLLLFFNLALAVLLLWSVYANRSNTIGEIIKYGVVSEIQQDSIDYNRTFYCAIGLPCGPYFSVLNEKDSGKILSRNREPIEITSNLSHAPYIGPKGYVVIEKFTIAVSR